MTGQMINLENGAAWSLEVLLVVVASCRRSTGSQMLVVDPATQTTTAFNGCPCLQGDVERASHSIYSIFNSFTVIDLHTDTHRDRGREN